MLDCETQDTTIQSLATLFSCSSVDLEQALSRRTLESDFVKREDELTDFRGFLLQYVSTEFRRPSKPEFIHWFHCTRVSRESDFAEGILPLKAILPRLERLLKELVPDPSHRMLMQQIFADKGRPHSHFRLKTSGQVHWGPYAILVRDVAFHANALCQHDYLSTPEIIEDVCSEMRTASGIDLMALYKAALVPAFVKFRAPVDGSWVGAISTALCYVWSCLQHGRPDANSVHCFDGGNRVIPACDILRVEFVSK